MNFKFKKTLGAFLFVCIVGTAALASDDFTPMNFSSMKTVNPNAKSSSDSEINLNLSRPSGRIQEIQLSENDAFCHFISATDKFVQSNVRASWWDFKDLIDKSPDNDFVYLTLSDKMAGLGFFDLADLSNSKIKDKNLSALSIDAMKRFYFPRKKLKLNDELALAEAYSNIIYNNQSSEATNDLLSKDNLLSNYDYANYMVALGSYKSGLYQRAAKYINIAILQNPENLNYKRLKAEILAQEGSADSAVKIVDDLQKQNLFAYEYEKKIDSLSEFVLYKTSKKQWQKDYHLAYYYYIEGDSSKAIRNLQDALSAKKHPDKGLIYGLMSEIYLSMNEFEKAADTAQKGYKTDSANPKILITLGSLAYRSENYKKALHYYKIAAKKDKKSYVPLIKEALVYQKTGNVDKAKELYTKVLKTRSDCWEAYYNVALLDKSKENIYLKKALAINPMFENGWIDLARNEMDRGNYKIAEKYLANAYSIDENDFKYYYYQGLVQANAGNYNQATFNLRKCLKLNPNFKDAEEKLNALNIKRDSI